MLYFLTLDLTAKVKRSTRLLQWIDVILINEILPKRDYNRGNYVHGKTRDFD